MLGGGEGPARGSCGPWGARRARPAGLETCAGPAVLGLNRRRRWQSSEEWHLASPLFL